MVALSYTEPRGGDVEKHTRLRALISHVRYPAQPKNDRPLALD